MKYFFTSINNAYVPKARILAESIRKVYGKDARVSCMLSDVKRDDVDYSMFDDVFLVEDLNLPVESLEAWIFCHSVVELCTAVKPFVIKKLFDEFGADAVVYMDPDTVLYSPLDEVYSTLKTHPVALTPHVTKPAVDLDDLLDGEMLGCLRHGVFNLGFVAIANHGEGRRFLDWWAARCLDWCYDDGPKGLFTDQRWIDLAPCLFDNLNILKHQGYNVATWNLYYRDVSRDAQGQLVVNGDVPLRFFHFSGFDLGTHESMLKKHAGKNQVLRELTHWYVHEQERFEQRELGRRPGAHDYFSTGIRITQAQRMQYRSSPDFIKHFPHPRSAPFFQQWYAENAEQTGTPNLSVWETVADLIKQPSKALTFAKQRVPPGVKTVVKAVLK